MRRWWLLALALLPAAALAQSQGGRSPLDPGIAGYPSALTAAIAAAQPISTALTCSGALTLTYPAAGDISYDVTLNGPCALSVVGGTPGRMQTMDLTVRQGAVDGWPLTLPGGVQWRYGLAPAPNTSGAFYDEFILRTKDGGVTYSGSY